MGIRRLRSDWASLFISGIKGIRKIHGDAEGKDQLNLKEGFKGKGKIGGFTGYWAKTRDSYWIWLRGLRLRSPISKDLYGSNTGLRLSMIISFRILDLVIVKTKLRDSEGISTYFFLMIFYRPVKETRRIISSFGLTIRRIGIWTVIYVGTLVRFDWDFDRGNVVGSFNFRRFGFTEVLDLGSSDQYKWRLGQLIGNSGDMKSGEGILIFMDQDLLVVRSSQQVMASGFYVGSVMVWIVLEMLWYLGSEFKIGVLWLVEDSVMVCEIWLWWKSVYVFVNSNEKWICLGFIRVKGFLRGDKSGDEWQIG
ncbi:hypothetical protein F2Q69_00035431 [Brassica cretica]|uniref:Uncharacterized protein n=1 Tax=Brassica cretica TaxID=69181 RepID=A0A8S9SSD9_BRACR|nr:hypothetical protein F2Q69_00035431 [Brassica cretica]